MYISWATYKWRYPSLHELVFEVELGLRSNSKMVSKPYRLFEMSSSQFELCVENPTLTSDMTLNNVYKWV